jgi:hypothetical protein
MVDLRRTVWIALIVSSTWVAIEFLRGAPLDAGLATTWIVLFAVAFVAGAIVNR